MNISFVKNVPFRFPVILAILLITATIIPILYLGIPYFPDQVHHFHIASDYAYSISHGDFFPSWAAQENFGYGGLGIRLYPPIPYYVLAFIHLATGEWYWASVLTYSFWLLLGCLGIFLWAREYYSPKMSLFAAVIFAFMPYRLFELYEVTMYGEFAGCAVLPFLFYFTHQICQKGNFKYTIGLAVTYAVLIFTHLPTTVIASFSLFIFSLGLIISLQGKQIIKTSFKLILAVCIGLILSAPFWLRVITEKKWLAANSIYPLPLMDFSQNFLPTFIDKAESTLHFDLILFLPLIFTVISLVAYSLYPLKKGIGVLSPILTLFAFSLLMITQLSLPLWKILPVIQEIQFPWRFLTVLSVSGSILAVSGWQNLKYFATSSKRPIILFLCGGLLFIVTFDFAQIIRNSTFIPKNEFAAWQADNDKAIGLEFWWTIWVRREIFEKHNKVFADNQEPEIKEWNAAKREFSISSKEAVQARVAVFYYPYWQAAVNGIKVEPISADDGAILIPIPAGESNVKLWFEEPFYLKMALYASFIGWFIISAFILQLIYRKIHTLESQ